MVDFFKSSLDQFELSKLVLKLVLVLLSYFARATLARAKVFAMLIDSSTSAIRGVEAGVIVP